MARYDDFQGRNFRPGFGWGPPRGRGGYDRDWRPPRRPDRPFADDWFGPEWRPRRRPRDVARSRPPTDRDILDAVCDKMTEDGHIQSEGIEVSVHNGVVTLRGEVADYMQARYAWDDAWETEGVRGVMNHLTVRADPRGG